MLMGNRFIVVVMASALLTFLSGCSSTESDSSDDPLTATNLRDRVSTALRSAGSFRFEMTMPDPQNPNDDVVTSGQITYGDDGEVTALAYTQRTVEYRFVDGTLYHRANENRDFRKLSDNAADSAVKLWDWVAAIERYPNLEKLRERGSDEIDGVATTKYEVVLEDRTETWWIDAEDRIVKQSTEQVESRLSDFGEPVDITAP